MPVHGILLLNKPSGVTSHDVVAKVRKILAQKEVGHSGTLDPLASGLLVILLGEATKLSQYVLEEDKGYELALRLGIRTDTLDITGQAIEEKPVHVKAEAVVAEALQLSGDLELLVPRYSAVKLNGQKMYDLARENQPMEQPLRSMRFYNIQSLGQTEKGDYRFSFRCSKGAYVRAWVEELGQRLGCGATMTELIRTYSAPYSLTEAIDLESLEASKGAVPIISMPLLLPHFKLLRVKGFSERLLANGQIAHDLRRQLIGIFQPERDVGVKVLRAESDELIALIGLDPDKGFVIRRVFRY